jgi:hypothetical protein
MVTLIYGCPTAGKTHALEELIPLTDKNLVDTDDLLSAKFLASSKFRYRKNNFRSFWDWWQTLPYAETLKVCQSLAVDIATLGLYDNVVAFTNFHTIGSLHPKVGFLRKPQSLADLYITRYLQKHGHNGPAPELPEWIRVYDIEAEKLKLVQAHPNIDIVVLGENQYMSDFLVPELL